MKRYTSKGYQLIRIMDMLYVAPVMVIAGIFGTGLQPFIRVSLVILGISTTIFNAINYVDTYKFNQKTKT